MVYTCCSVEFIPLLSLSKPTLCKYRHLGTESPMRVRVKLIANYMKLLPPGTQGNTIELESLPGATIGGLLGPLGVPLDDRTVLLLNGLQAEPDAPLSDGDMVTAFSAIAGGATDCAADFVAHKRI